ncbi:MAG: preprotein translocase subunit SecG [Candidatus Daviesbacteria bacterium]|nr:preprotein translocase subunit SecG [Candidatus Daviesbacteria bacterium]
MKIAVSLIQIILGVILVFIIIIQQKGSGLGTSFGGDMGFYRTKRGAEKLLFYGTIVIVFLFIIFSVVGLFVF